MLPNEHARWLGQSSYLRWRFGALVSPLMALAITACSGNTASLGPGTYEGVPGEPCTDFKRCCPPEELVCEGNIDSVVVCSCDALWDCSESADKCERKRPTPPGGGDWACSWSALHYTCSKKSAASDPPPGGNGWHCSWSGAESQWVCKQSQPNPPNNPYDLSWTCVVLDAQDKLVCTKNKGTAPPKQPPKVGGSGARDSGPPQQDSGEPTCVPGSKRWCDGLVYCGWGQMTCKANGTWPTTMVSGKVVEDCIELSNGARPNTLCACYHFYFNDDCCERPDCIVPVGTPPRLCPKSPGKLCDYCNPQTPGCQHNAKCVVMSRGEAFCSRSCSQQTPCPSGFDCTALSTKAGTSHQCIPSDGSCFY
jgi:hypothetical protein